MCGVEGTGTDVAIRGKCVSKTVACGDRERVAGSVPGASRLSRHAMKGISGTVKYQGEERVVRNRGSVRTH